MSKTIVLCLDSTWDGPDARAADGTSAASNVQKVFESLSGSGPNRQRARQRRSSASGQPGTGLRFS